VAPGGSTGTSASFSVDGTNFVLPGITGTLNTTEPGVYATKSVINGQIYYNVTANVGGNSGLLMLLHTDSLMANQDYTATGNSSEPYAFSYTKNGVMYQTIQASNLFTLHVSNITNGKLNGTFNGNLSTISGTSYQTVVISNGVLTNVKIIY
ncbi:MAG: hypothetical protein ABIY51_07345, partial [Ferruginibacter sp.]